MCTTVASRLSTANTRIVRYGMRIAAQLPDSRASTTSTHPAAYAAPRKEAVAGGWIVQAKWCSVLDASTNRTTKASAVRVAKARNNQRVP